MSTTTSQVRHFDEQFKIEVARRYLRGEGSYRELSRKTGVGKSQIFDWVRNFAEKINAIPSEPMKKKGKKICENVNIKETTDKDKEIATLRKQLAEKEKELAWERLRAEAYDTMIGIAEKRWNIEIRKKAGAKQ